MSYRIFDGYMSPQSDGYVHVTNAGTPIYLFDGYNLALLTATGSYGGGHGVIFIPNGTVIPTANPVGGGILYVENGALKYRGPSGTVTVLGPA